MPLLEEWGFGVQVPSWWDRQSGATAALGIRATLSPRAHAGRIMPTTRRFIADAGLAERIAVVPVDIVREPLPGR